MKGFATMAIREKLLIIGAMMDYNKDNPTALLHLEEIYSAMSFCLTSIEQIDRRILMAQIENAHLKADVQQLKKENRELEKKIEDLLSRIEL